MMDMRIIRVIISKHYKNKRNKRDRIIKECLGGDGRVVDSFIIDKGHEHGKERHDVTNNGIIIIYNAESNKLVTRLIARPSQIKRYYKNIGRKPPTWLVNLAQHHKELNYNR